MDKDTFYDHTLGSFLDGIFPWHLFIAWVSAWNSVVMKLDSQLDSITGMLLSVDSLPNSLNSFEMQSVCIWKLLLCFSLLGKAYRLVLNICVPLVHYSCLKYHPLPSHMWSRMGWVWNFGTQLQFNKGR